jgi:site-specific DNA-methyltransferase (adenine-specific)
MAHVLQQSQRRWWNETYAATIYRYPDGEIALDDALHLLGSLRQECAAVAFLDPPFNLGKAYGSNGKRADLRSEADYLDYMTRIVSRAAEILKPGGALYLYHIPKWAIRLANVAEHYLDFRHWIAVSMKNGFVRGQRLYPAHYALLYFTKGDPSSFTRPKIPRPLCAKCKKDLRDYGGYKKYVENGINLSDIWDDISPVRHKTVKYRNSNELPMKLVSRILQISGKKGSLLVDPFAGTGSMLVAARAIGMKFVAGDLDMEFIGIMDTRLRQSHSGHSKPEGTQT